MNRFLMHMSIPGLLITVLAGCATTSDGGGAKVSDEGVRATISAWASAMQSQQVEAAVACYSASFQHPDWGNRDGVRDAIEQARVIGYLDGMQVDLTGMNVSKEGDVYRAAPVRLSGGFGEHVYAFRLRDEDGVARIVGSETLAESAASLAAGNQL